MTEHAAPDLDALVRALQRPECYPHDAHDLAIVHTHASIVALVDAHVYKFKRPVSLGFLDYSTPALRLAACEAEVALNRRLAPDVYLGVTWLREGPQGLSLGPQGQPREPCVHMRRLPDEASLSWHVEHDTLGRAQLAAVAARLQRFHAQARRGDDVRAWARFEPVLRNVLDNFEALRAQPQLDMAALLERLEQATAPQWLQLRALVERRAALACEGHGDLRLEHVYLLPPGDVPTVIDGVEFSLPLRALDPVADLAFLAMDLQCHGAWWAADALWQASLPPGDEAWALVEPYVAYRSLVRAKVRALQAAAGGDAAPRLWALARAHVLQAMVATLPVEQRPLLVLVAGLPGTGKSVLAHGLEQHAGMVWLRADAIRKQLAGLGEHASAHTQVRAGIYTPAWNDRTYDECLARAAAELGRGGRVVVDASFKEEGRRRAFVDLARGLGIPVRLLTCEAPTAAVRQRLAARHDDASDADWGIYEHVRATWEPLSGRCAAIAHAIDTSDAPQASLAAALRALASPCPGPPES
ncbi:MAG: AAA family ATPase [Nannocystaceae bacterium]|nr:AAA family ATPase [Nannocystaceae bacterium]